MRYGVGRWAQILAQGGFHRCRNSVALKDKWRLLLKDEEEAREAELHAQLTQRQQREDWKAWTQSDEARRLEAEADSEDLHLPE